MGAFSERRPSASTEANQQVPLQCPEDVDWIFDIDTLRSSGGEALRRHYSLEDPPRDSPHYPFQLTSASSGVWDREIRKLSMASGESHILLTSPSKLTGEETVFYVRVAGYREEGLPRVVANFQKIEKSSLSHVTEGTRQNWLYLLHEIKNPISILQAAEDLRYQAGAGEGEAERARSFALMCLEDHLRNGVFLATEDTSMIPVQEEPLDLELFLNDLQAAFGFILRIQQNRLEMDLDLGGFTRVRMDRTLLSQLLSNLLINKINHLKNQAVRLRVRVESDRTDGMHPFLSIALEDEGPAFPDFVLQGAERAADLRGLLDVHRHSGLGLSICRRIVSVLGGEIRFFNDPPKTRIRIRIPLG